MKSREAVYSVHVMLITGNEINSSAKDLLLASGLVGSQRTATFA